MGAIGIHGAGEPAGRGRPPARAVPGAIRAGRGGEPVALADGTRVLVRPMREDDAPRLRRLHSRLSPQTIYRRFMTACPRLPERTLRYLVTLDRRDTDALVAVHGGEIVGVGRYHRRCEDEAEIAVLVEDAWQRRGIGRVLAERVARLAAARGVRVLTGSMLRDNPPAHRLLVSLFPDARTHVEHGELIFRILISDLPAGAAAR